MKWAFWMKDFICMATSWIGAGAFAKEGGALFFIRWRRRSIIMRQAQQSGDPVRFAVMQQTSVWCTIWQKYHGLGGRIGIRCSIIFRLVSRWLAAFLEIF